MAKKKKKDARQATVEADNLFQWLEHVLPCTSPFPLRCNLCKFGNRGVGLDHCALKSWRRNYGPETFTQDKEEK